MRGDYASYDKGTALRKWANRNKEIQTLTVDSVTEWWNLTISQLGRVRIFKAGWIWNCLRTHQRKWWHMAN